MPLVVLLFAHVSCYIYIILIVDRHFLEYGSLPSICVIRLHQVLISATCWSDGDIKDNTFTEKSNVFTVEECQHQCKNDDNCAHFTFDMDIDACRLYGKNAIANYKWYLFVQERI